MISSRIKQSSNVTPILAILSEFKKSNFSTLNSKEPYQTKPVSLYYERPYDVANPKIEKSFFGKIFLKIMGYYSKHSTRIRGSNNLYKAVTEQASNDAFYDAIKLKRAFASEYGILCVHIWMILKRLKNEGNNGSDLGQELYDTFQENVEHRVREAGVKVRVKKWLKQLEKNFYGSAQAYDKALEGKEELFEALIRNVYGNEEDKSGSKILERYILREISCLAKTDSNYIMKGKIKFSNPF